MGVKGIKKPRPSQEGVCPNFFILILILKKRCKGSVFILNHQMICAKSAHMTNNLKQICKMNKRMIQITDAKVR